MTATAKPTVGWIDYVEAVTLTAPANSSWLIRAYLEKHENRWVRYTDENERSTPYSTPALYQVKLWADAAMRTARVLAWNNQLPGEDYYAAFGRIAHEITQHPDYSLCDQLETIWNYLKENQA